MANVKIGKFKTITMVLYDVKISELQQRSNDYTYLWWQYK